MIFYLDEDISPRIAEILRKLGGNAISAHEVEMTGVSDEEQMEYAVQQKRCLVTFNRNDFIFLTRQYLESSRAHFGVIVIPHTFRGNDFSGIAEALLGFSEINPAGIPAYTIAFLK